MFNKCLIDGCEKPARAKHALSMCNMHCARVARAGHPNLNRRENGLGNINKGGYVDVRDENGRRVYQHVLVAEKALGKRLPKGAKVHHWDRNRSNNAGTNLLICPDEAYHQLIHRRMAAVEAGAQPHWRKCQFCKQFDAPENLKFRANGQNPHHVRCASQYRVARYRKEREERRKC